MLKDKLEERLSELEKVKKSLLKKEKFLDPENKSFVYASQAISQTGATQGVTPNNLSEVLELVATEINDYAEYISGLPYVEQNVINRERDEKELALVSKKRLDFSSPVTWEEMADDITIYSARPYLHTASYYGSVKSIKFYSSPTIRGETDLSVECKIFHINSRLNINTEYRSGTGPMDAKLTNLQPDDIFIIGLIANESYDENQIYYQDLSYRVECEMYDGTIDTKSYTIANTRIGSSRLSYDNTVRNMCICWDIIVVNRFPVEVMNALGDTSVIDMPHDGELSGGMFQGNILTGIKFGQFATDTESRRLSYRSGCSWYRSIVDDRYMLFDKHLSSATKIVFNNLRPIDHVLEEAINGL